MSKVPCQVRNSSETEASLLTSSSLSFELNYTATPIRIFEKNLGFLLNIGIDFGKLLATTVMTRSLKISVNKRCKFLGFLKQQQAKQPISKIASGNHYRLFLAKGGKQFC